VKGRLMLAGRAVPVPTGSARPGLQATRRGLLALLLVLGGMLGSMPFFAPSVAAESGSVATVVADGAPLLAGHDDTTIIDYMEYGATVDVLYGPYNGMYEILYYGVHGWTWTDKLDIGAVGGGEAAWSEPAAAADSGGSSPVVWWSEPSWVVIDTDMLNVRSGAGTWSTVWDVYPGGTWVEIVGSEVDGYYPISYGDGVAWVAAQYLSWDGTTSYGSASSGASSAAVGGAWSADEHWIDVNRTTGAVTLYIGDVAQNTFWGSLGFDDSPDGFYSTAVGTFYVTRKYKDLAYTAYADGYITDWVAFDESRDNGFHSWTKDAYGNVLPWGAGQTGGCVALDTWAAAAVFDFSFVGMRVVVHD